MSSERIGPEGRVVTFIDLGTNSLRMLIVRLNANHSYTILSRQKQQVRLGEGEFEEEEKITPAAMDRAVVVAKKFVDLARTFHTEEFVAVATSATREAINQNELLHRIRQEAGLDIRIISGREEARLIFLGVASAINLPDRRIFCIDIGGGSTEIAVGDSQGYHHLDSFRIGAIRLANLYPCPDEKGIVIPDQQKKIQRHVRNSIVNAIATIRELKPDSAIGSSGTIMNLAEIAEKALHPATEPTPKPNGHTLKYKELKKVIELLAPLTIEQRRKVPGINPERADIIVPGAIILEIFMKELGLFEISVTGRGLQDGLLVDYLTRLVSFPLMGELTPRQRSVLQLGRSCGINEVHARTVTTLVLEMFDSAKTKKLHDLSDAERELLEYAAFLHDIGSFISFTNHHAHSYYIIRNSELLGFNDREVNIIAMLARFHRKRSPRKKDLVVTDLDARDQRTLRLLSCFLRLGESLDRSHAALVQHVRFSAGDKTSARLEILARGDCQLEIWGIESEMRAFAKAFGRKLVFSVKEVPSS